jgi:hypothetical protein
VDHVRDPPWTATVKVEFDCTNFVLALDRTPYPQMTPNAIKAEALPEWDTHEVRLAPEMGPFLLAAISGDPAIKVW